MLSSQALAQNIRPVPFQEVQKKLKINRDAEPTPVVLLYQGILLDDILAESLGETTRLKLRIVRTKNEEQAARMIQELKPSKVVVTRLASFSVEKLANILASSGGLETIKIYAVSVAEDSLEIFDGRKAERARFMSFENFFRIVAAI